MASKSTPKGIQSFDDFYRALKTAQHATYQSRPHAKVRGQTAFEEQKAHLVNLYAGVKVLHSFQDTAGQVFDCIPADEQPALKASGQKLAQPPIVPSLDGGGAPQKLDAPFMPLHATRLDNHGNTMHCPPGCVAVRRVTLDELTRFETLSHFLRKGPRHPDRKRPAVETPETPSQANIAHQYAHAYQDIQNHGGSSVLNIWAPPVSGSSIFSLSQQWFVAPWQKGVQTAEVGWQVYPQKYGHSKPVLFSYWTADGYKTTGSYSTDQHEFVQYSATCPLGFALDHASIADGAQSEIQATFLLSGGAWWLFIGGTGAANAIGYYPTSLYQGGPLATGAWEADFGGETCGADTFPAMGSGGFAARGYKEAAYQRNIYVFDAQTRARTADLTPRQDHPTSYTIELQHSHDWGEFFFFGGPGTPG